MRLLFVKSVHGRIRLEVFAKELQDISISTFSDSLSFNSLVIFWRPRVIAVDDIPLNPFGSVLAVDPDVSTVI